MSFSSSSKYFMRRLIGKHMKTTFSVSAR